MSAAELCRDHPDEIAGRYRLGPVLRRSPGCCAHRATDRLLRRTVSVALVEGEGLVLPEQSWQGRSPEVAEVYDGGAWRGRLFLVTQHPGATLAETTPPAGLSAVEVRDLGLAVADALAPLHRHGRAHGGIGPGTVARTDRGAVFSDVGLLPWLARWSDVRLDPPYPAPGDGPATAADVYAVGRLLDELAPRRLPAATRTLLTDMTAADPAARPDIAVVADRLRALPVPSRRRVGAAGARRRRAVVVAAAALLLGSGVGLGAVVSAAGGGSSTAYASAVEPTLVPGVPLPPTVAAAPPVPGPAPAVDADVVRDVDEVPAVEAPAETPAAEAPRPVRAPVQAVHRRDTSHDEERPPSRSQEGSDERRERTEHAVRPEPDREDSDRRGGDRTTTRERPRDDDSSHRDRDRARDGDQRDGDRKDRGDRSDRGHRDSSA
ncbi:hypothetical protein [Actinomycetospora soli]|uniref:hypothetical protein n=1 Tax=Actinomycetospora soli TaxID=2893887 RepID=UPI001E36AB2A|nr:hypothetical protein [Actinomycetospora soli]MCD2189695.1 hypothetical protein [Actinomycetospora soli]